MNPVLFQFQSFTVYTFGFAITLASLISVFLLWRRMKKFGYEDESIIDMVIFSGFLALIFARLFYVLAHWEDFSGSILKIVLVTYFPGLDGVGALLGIIIAVGSFTLIKRWTPLVVLDSVFFSLGLGIFVTMLGSFFSGSLPGIPTDSNFGVAYPGLEGLRHPISLYWMIISIIFYVLVVFIDRKNNKKGLITSIFLIIYGVSLGFLQIYSVERLILAGVSISLVLSILMTVLGVLLMYLVFLKSKKAN